MKKILSLAMFLLATLMTDAQEMIESYVINIEDGKAYLDITAPKAKVGDVLSIREKVEDMVHPKTKKKIKRVGKIIADLEIIEMYEEYSVATIYPPEIISKIEVGMIAEMPELPAGAEKNDATEDVTDEPQTIVPTDAEGIVNRFLQVTNIDRRLIKKEVPFSVRRSESFTNAKGKLITAQQFYAFDMEARKVYMSQVASKAGYDNLLVINGNEGWFGFYKTVSKLATKRIKESWENIEYGHVLDLNVFDGSKFQYRLGGKREVRGKQCTGVVFTSFKSSETTKTYYFDDATGLIALVVQGNSDNYYTEYRDFGGMTLCYKQQVIYKGEFAKRIRERNITLQEVCLDCPLDYSLFTKEGAKRAFKKK